MKSVTIVISVLPILQLILMAKTITSLVNTVSTTSGIPENSCDLSIFYDYVDSDHIDMLRFSWWYLNSDWVEAPFLDTSYDDAYLSFNSTIYNRCEEYICTGNNLITLTGEIDPRCCTHNNHTYNLHHPIYKDDCIGYVCNYGTWVKTIHSDPACCSEPDKVTDGWYDLGETKVISDCTEVICSSRNNWISTGDEIPNCNLSEGCDFDGVHYNQAERLPGCFQVFCLKGAWVQGGHIDENCSECSAYWDLHLFTFDGFKYDYHGTCEYALAQEGTTTNPEYAVNSEFINCWGAACVGPSTFKDRPGTVLKMGSYGRFTPDLYKILVNGEPYEIPDNTPRLVKEGVTEHPVLAWRHRLGCIRLLGSTQIAVEKCGSSLSIWASPEFHGKLYGLCGHFDGDIKNDFTKRDGIISSLEQFPTGIGFPSSWETICAMDMLPDNVTLMPLSRIKRSWPGNCTLENGVGDSLRSKCNQSVGASGSLSQERIDVLIENCVYDSCSIYQNTSGDSNALEEWLGEVRKSVEDFADVENKTTAEDVLPDTSLQEPFDVPTAVFRDSE